MSIPPPRAGEWLGLGAGAAVVASLFLPWYAPAVTGWRALRVLDLVLLATALLAAAGWASGARARSPALPMALAALTAALGAVATLATVIRVIDPPAGAGGARPGAALGVAAAAAVVVGAALALREDPPLEGEAARRAAADELARAEVLPPPPGARARRPDHW